MPGRERGRLRIGGMKRLGRCHDKLWLICPPMKWQTNMDGHESCTETGFFSLHQRLAFPLCMGNHHTWNRCTSPTPCKTTSSGGHEERTPQENNGKAVTQWPTSKASLGWKNRELHLESWMSTGVSTKDGWRPQVKWFGSRPPEGHMHKTEGWHLYPLMLMDSEPKEECCHSLHSGSQQARPTKI